MILDWEGRPANASTARGMKLAELRMSLNRLNHQPHSAVLSAGS